MKLRPRECKHVENRFKELRLQKSDLKIRAKYSTPEINTSEIIVDFSGIFQRIVTCPVDVYGNCPMDFQ